MPHAIRFAAHGGPEVLRWEEVNVAAAAAGELRVRNTAVGLNYIDIYHREGLYPVPLPSGIGLEAAGVVVECGPGVTDFAPGDRVAGASGPLGAYAEERIVPADRVVKIPDGIGDAQAASMMLKGMTTHYLLRRTYRVQPGDIVLIHAAAGGVGLIACQWAKHLGATVIGTVGSDEKAALAAAHGCDHPIVYAREDFVARVAGITGGRKCNVVYDSVGRDTFMKSLDCLRPLGTLVLFGMASGPVPAFEPGILGTKGSLTLSRPSLAHYTATREDLVATANELFDVVLKGAVKIEVNQTVPLREAAAAQRALTARKTTGSTVMIV
ncbi:MAG: quinone oxidoreductase [Gammaproteobacteria bacterium]|nr:quinone oxidoreductase [Gammaproteobacteria bacterium]MBI5618698.1 quinone oxidoreductase [Gammaproteobacteria bacterium]